MSSPGSITGLFADLRSLDKDVRNRSAQVIWDRFTRELLEIVRRRLSWRVRVKEDEQDVLQAAYLSFFARQQQGRFDLKDRGDLWNLLVTITLRKAQSLASYYHRDRRSVQRETPAGEEGAVNGGLPAPLWMLERMDRFGPTPAEAALLKEEVEWRLASLTEDLRTIAVLKMQDYTNEEIAEKIDRSTRTVELRLQRIRAEWEKDDPRS